MCVAEAGQVDHFRMKCVEEKFMAKVFTYLAAIAFGLLALIGSQGASVATPVAPLASLDRFVGDDRDLMNIHGWHCGSRLGRWSWHRHRYACGYDPYDDGYDDPGYDDGGTVIIRPRHSRKRSRRANRRCTRKIRRHCNRRWRNRPSRRARCLRKYKCR